MEFDECEDLKQEIGDNVENSLNADNKQQDVIDDGDEPLDLGEPHMMTDEEYEKFKNEFTDTSENSSNEDNKQQDVIDDGDEPLDLGNSTETTDEGNDKYVDYEDTDDYKRKATDPNCTGTELHNGFIEHLKKWNK